MNKYLVELNNFKQQLVEKNLEEIKKSILKLNNPTFYSKYTYQHPTVKYDYPEHTNIQSPLQKFHQAVLAILSENSFDMIDQLEIEYSWLVENQLNYWFK